MVFLLALGALSDSATAQVLAPKRAEALARHGHRIDLRWKDVSRGEVAYRVTRSCGAADARKFCTLAELPPNASGYIDLQLEEDKRYIYRVSAVGGSRSPFAEVEATTLASTLLPSADPPIYFEPQRAWSYGPPVSLEGLQRVDVSTNVAFESLRILLDRSDSRSLIGTLKGAGLEVKTKRGYRARSRRGHLELYLHDFGSKPPRASLPGPLEPFERMGDEGYVLVAEETALGSLRIVVGANGAKGLYRGSTTALRLILDDTLSSPRNEVHPVVVLDYPDHAVRSVLPNWTRAKMHANLESVPPETLDLLDKLARAGASAVQFDAYWSAVREHSWSRTGRKAAAAIQIAARARFMEVHYDVGTSSTLIGLKGPPVQTSFDTWAYLDGLAVLDEPFVLRKTTATGWLAHSERRGAQRVRDPGMNDVARPPWSPGRCKGSPWSHDDATGRPGAGHSSWRLSGKTASCSLVQELPLADAFAPGRYFFSAWSKTLDTGPATGQIRLQIRTRKGERRTYPLPIPASPKTSLWQQSGLAIDFAPGDVVESASIVVEASVDQGTLWVDDVELYEWSGEILPYGGFDRGNGWPPLLGSVWRRDDRVGRTDRPSLRLDLPYDSGNLSGVTHKWSRLSLPRGRYVLGAWIKGRNLKGQLYRGDADINLFLYDYEATAKKHAVAPILQQHLPFPREIPESDGWVYQYTVFDISAESARAIKSARLQLRSTRPDGEGTLWIDDVRVARLSGDLRNLAGGVKPPVITDLDGNLYRESEHYEVCQVVGRKEICSPPDNYTTINPGDGYSPGFSESLQPFEIRWIGQERPRDDRIRVNYDIAAQFLSAGPPQSYAVTGDVFSYFTLNLCDFDTVAKGIHLTRILGQYLDGYTIEDFPERGKDYEFKANTISWRLSEIRGINRSVACFDSAGNRIASNAKLLADVTNTVVDLARSRNPDVRFFLWNDMYSPFTNGGIISYQKIYGGTEGATACAFAPDELPELCGEESDIAMPIKNKEIVMVPWSYWPPALRGQVAISSWYQGLGVSSWVMPASNQVTIDDWAGIAHTFDQVEGGIGSHYDGGSGVIQGTRAFWNHDWKLVYLEDNETPESSYYQIPWPIEPALTLHDATRDVEGKCGVMGRKFEKNNDGGVCLSKGAAITLGPIPVVGGRRYRAGIYAQRSDQTRPSSPPTATPALRVSWSGPGQDAQSGSEPLREMILVWDAGTRRLTDWFDRYRVEFEAPHGAQGMTLEISFQDSGDFIAADNISIWESIHPCFDDCAQDAIVTSAGIPTPEKRGAAEASAPVPASAQ